MKIQINVISLLSIGLLSALALACGGGGGSDTKTVSFSRAPITANEFALFKTVDSSFTAGSFSAIDTTNFTVNKTIKTFSTSDILVRGFGRDIFVIGRRNADFVQRFDVSDPGTELYNYSTLSNGETTQNPQDLIIKDLNNAYIPRLGSSLVWKVDLAASSADTFKTARLNFTQYVDSDGIPEIARGILVGTKLFLACQRLDRDNGWASTNTSYVIVIDTLTDLEVDTGMSESGSGLLGIALPARNPGDLVFVPETGKIYVQCVGQYGSSFSGTDRFFNGGLVEIDPTTYETKLLIDDGDDTTPAARTATGLHGGLFDNLAILNKDKGFIALYAGWQNVTLKTFNPSTGEMGSAVPGFENTDIRGLNIDQNGRLWISSGTGVTVLDAASESVVQSNIDVGLIPQSDAQFSNY